MLAAARTTAKTEVLPLPSVISISLQLLDVAVGYSGDDLARKTADVQRTLPTVISITAARTTADALPTLQDQQGKTALHLAAAADDRGAGVPPGGHMSCIKDLVSDYGATPALKQTKGDQLTILHIAVRLGTPPTPSAIE